VPEYQARGVTGPATQTHQASTTAAGEGSDAGGTQPAATVTCQTARTAPGTMSRLTSRATRSGAVGRSTSAEAEEKSAAMLAQRRTSFSAPGGVPVSCCCVFPVAAISGPKSMRPAILAETSDFV